MDDDLPKTAMSGRSSVPWSVDTPSQLSIRIPTALSYRNEPQHDIPKRSRRRPPRNLLRHSLAAKLVENKFERVGFSPCFREKPKISGNLGRIFPDLKCDAKMKQNKAADEQRRDVVPVSADWDMVEDAVMISRKLKDRLRREVGNTVASHSLSSSSLNTYVTAETPHSVRKQSMERNVRKKSTARTLLLPTRDSTNNDEPRKTKPQRPEYLDNQHVKHTQLRKVRDNKPIPGLYSFPKTDDFIGRDIPRFIAGFKWHVGEANQTMPNRPRGKRCRVSHPIALGLQRQGTSVSQQKGQTLGRGDWNVVKVWHRKLDNFVLPAQMAKEDTIGLLPSL